MSFKTDRARFMRHAQQPNGWKFARYKIVAATEEPTSARADSR